VAKPRPEKKGGPTPPPVLGPALNHVAAGMHRQGFDGQLTQYDDRGWRATHKSAEAARRSAGLQRRIEHAPDARLWRDERGPFANVTD
jgi:hypothetical protein